MRITALLATLMVLLSVLGAPAPSRAERLIYANVLDGATVNTTTTETSLGLERDPGVASMRAKHTNKLVWCGKYSTNGTPTLRLQFKVGTILMLDTTALTMASSVTDQAWRLEVDYTVRTAGASATAQVNGVLYLQTAAGTATVVPIRTAATGSLNAQSNHKLTATWGTSHASNSITLEDCKFYVKNAPSN